MDSLAAQDVKTRPDIDEENHHDANQDEKIRFEGTPFNREELK